MSTPFESFVSEGDFGADKLAEYVESQKRIIETKYGVYIQAPPQNDAVMRGPNKITFGIKHILGDGYKIGDAASELDEKAEELGGKPNRIVPDAHEYAKFMVNMNVKMAGMKPEDAMVFFEYEFE